MGAFPISIKSSDMTRFSKAEDRDVAKLRAEFGGHHRVILGVDRLDYTKESCSVSKLSRSCWSRRRWIRARLRWYKLPRLRASASTITA